MRVKRQLNPGGLFVQWIHVYEFNDRLLATILRALDAEFRDYEVYAANDGDLIIVASPKRFPRAQRANSPRGRRLSPMLERVRLRTVDELQLAALQASGRSRAVAGVRRRRQFGLLSARRPGRADGPVRRRRGQRPHAHRHGPHSRNGIAWRPGTQRRCDCRQRHLAPAAASACRIREGNDRVPAHRRDGRSFIGADATRHRSAARNPVGLRKRASRRYPARAHAARGKRRQPHGRALAGHRPVERPALGAVRGKDRSCELANGSTCSRPSRPAMRRAWPLSERDLRTKATRTTPSEPTP